MKKNTFLVCKKVIFNSNDKICFIEWLKKIKSIKAVYGQGFELHLHFDGKNITDNDLIEIVSLFDRYKINMKQLKIFLNGKNKKWVFEGDKGYWYDRMFC